MSRGILYKTAPADWNGAQVDGQMVGAGFNQKSMRKYRYYDHMPQTHAHIPQLLIIYI